MTYEDLKEEDISVPLKWDTNEVIEIIKTW